MLFFRNPDGTVFSGWRERRKGCACPAMSHFGLQKVHTECPDFKKQSRRLGAGHVTTRTENRPECEIERGRSVPVAAPVAFTRHSMITGNGPLIFFSVFFYFLLQYRGLRSYLPKGIYLHTTLTHTCTHIHTYTWYTYIRYTCICTNVYIKKIYIDR